MKLNYIGAFTQIGWLNVILLQWFCIRLRATCELMEVKKLQIIGLIMPLTGWRWSVWKNYIWIKRLWG